MNARHQTLLTAMNTIEVAELGSDAALEAIVSAFQTVVGVARWHLLQHFEIPDWADNVTSRETRREQIASILDFICRSMMMPGGETKMILKDSSKHTPPAFVAFVLATELRLLNIGQLSDDFKPSRKKNAGISETGLMMRVAAVAVSNDIKRIVAKQEAWEEELVSCGTSRKAIGDYQKSVIGSPFAGHFDSFSYTDLAAAKDHLQKIIERIKSPDIKG